MDGAAEVFSEHKEGDDTLLAKCSHVTHGVSVILSHNVMQCHTMSHNYWYAPHVSFILSRNVALVCFSTLLLFFASLPFQNLSPASLLKYMHCICTFHIYHYILVSAVSQSHDQLSVWGVRGLLIHMCHISYWETVYV